MDGPEKKKMPTPSSGGIKFMSIDPFPLVVFFKHTAQALKYPSLSSSARLFSL